MTTTDSQQVFEAVAANGRDRVPQLVTAAEHGDRELAQILLDGGADRGVTKHDGQRPADTARAAGHDDLVELLTD